MGSKSKQRMDDLVKSISVLAKARNQLAHQAEQRYAPEMAAVKGWEKCKVRDICELGRGRVISGQEIEHNPGVFPVYSSQSSNNGKMGAIDTFDFDGEYVTWTTDGAYAGTIFHRSGKFNCTNVCGTDPDISMPFIAYILSTLARDHVSYVGNPKLMNGVMANIEITIPTSKPEQAKIAEILSMVDRAIEQTAALIAKQQRIKTGLMQDLLTRGIDEHGNLRSEHTHQFKDSPLGRIPVEWDVLTTGEVTKSLVPGRDKPDLDRGGVPWITIPDINELYLSAAKSALSLSQQAIKAVNARLMPIGTVLMSCVGEFGIAAIVKAEVVANQQLHGFICGDQIVPEWLAFQIISNGDRIDQMATQTTIKYLNKSGCESILISLPNWGEQERVIAVLMNCHNLLFQHESHLAKLCALKTALMQDLLTGKVRVNPLLDKKEEAA